jgi:mRNA interferase MazF
MTRGEVWWTQFDELETGDSKVRPAVIVSNEHTNLYSNRVQVIPCTTNISKVYECETVLEVGGKQTKAMADRLQTIPKTKLMTQITILDSTEMEAVERCLLYQLNL